MAGDNGPGELTGVLDSPGLQPCEGELFRSDGEAFTLSARSMPETVSVSDVGPKMWICVWDPDDKSNSHACSPYYFPRFIRLLPLPSPPED